MQRIAAELNAPTTGFVEAHAPGPPPVFHIRYFTPRQEIDLCGHVTVAIFIALAAEGKCEPGHGPVIAYQRTSAGDLPVRLFPGPGGQPIVEMQLRLPTFEPAPVEDEVVRGVMGGTRLHPTLPVEVVATGLRHLAVPFARTEDLSGLDPDFKALAGLSRDLKIDTVCAFAPTGRRGCVRLRDFCAGIGVDEEPASGTTSGALACYLAKHRVVLPDHGGEVRVRVDQGIEMGRASRIEARVGMGGDAFRHVRVQGRAILVMEGSIVLAPG